MDDLVQIT